MIANLYNKFDRLTIWLPRLQIIRYSNCQSISTSYSGIQPPVAHAALLNKFEEDTYQAESELAYTNLTQ